MHFYQILNKLQEKHETHHQHRLQKQINATCRNVADPESKQYIANAIRAAEIMKNNYPQCGDWISLQTAKDRAILGIPEQGKHVKFGSKLSDFTLRRTIKNNLYAHWKLTAQEGSPADIHGEKLADGWYEFVILNNNEPRFLPTAKKDCGYHPYSKYRAHTQLADGKPVYSAGDFLVENGKIKKIDGGSGHYGTEAEKYVEYARRLFSYIGIDTHQTEVIVNPKLSGGNRSERTKRKMHVFFKSLTMPGEEAENRPKATGPLLAKLPRF